MSYDFGEACRCGRGHDLWVTYFDCPGCDKKHLMVMDTAHQECSRYVFGSVPSHTPQGKTLKDIINKYRLMLFRTMPPTEKKEQ